MRNRKKTPFLEKLMVPIGVFLAIGLLCGGIAGYFNPLDHTLIAFAGLAYPFLLLANFIFLIWWLARKKWIYAVFTLVAIAAGWHTLNATVGFFGNEGANEKADSSLIRVMTYNVHSFKPYDGELTKDGAEKVLSMVKTQNPDVICFQEFYTRFKGTFNTIDSLKKILHTNFYYFEPKAQSSTEAIGFAVFSKYPIANRGEIKFSNSPGNGSVFIDVRVQNQLIRIYNIHLQSISFEKRDYMYIDKVKEMETKVAPSKRILHMLKMAFRKRSRQVDVMKAHMRTCTTPFVLTGDFNDTPASYAVTKMSDSLYNAFKEKGWGLGKTYNGKFPNFQIDYIMTTKDITIDNYRVIKTELSDHYPVRSDLRLKSISN